MQSLFTDLLCYLGSFLPLSDILSLMRTSKKLAKVYNSNNFWTARALLKLGTNTHAKLRCMNQQYLSKLETHVSPFFNEYIYYFIYPSPPYRVENNGYSKNIKPDIEVIRANRYTVGYISSSVSGDQEIDVIIVSYNPRLTIDGGIPYHYLDISQRMISEELRELILPYWIKNRSYVQIFDIKFRADIFTMLAKLGYTQIYRGLKKEDSDRYQELWKEYDN